MISGCGNSSKDSSTSANSTDKTFYVSAATEGQERIWVFHLVNKGQTVKVVTKARDFSPPNLKTYVPSACLVITTGFTTDFGSFTFRPQEVSKAATKGLKGEAPSARGYALSARDKNVYVNCDITDNITAPIGDIALFSHAKKIKSLSLRVWLVPTPNGKAGKVQKIGTNVTKLNLPFKGRYH